MLGGAELRRECSRLPVRGPPGSDVRCPQGEVAVTRATGGLAASFNCIVHAVPPFFALTASGEPCPDWRARLEGCWLHALEAAQPHAEAVVAPLIGAGARGAPVEHAARVAAGAAASWLRAAAPEPAGTRELYLSVQSEILCEILRSELRAALQ
ncbi:hypothetical protein T492DRAFT_841898 [Pavlovales sp. CCMP2436]|nr:hypothetical protein T492DRAFT_841898 [Pavlovales sp. CCMP2436]